MSTNNSGEFFTEYQMDVLKEIGNIGTGNAATAISKMLNRRVDVANINVSWVDFNNCCDIIGGPENTVLGILFNLSGAMKGMIIHVLELSSARTVVEVMLGKSTSSDNLSDEMEQSALAEFGNIVVGAYANAMADMLLCQISPSVPYLAVDMANAIMSVPVAEFGKITNQVLYIDASLTVSTGEFAGTFLFVPCMESSKKFLRMLGVE